MWNRDEVKGKADRIKGRVEESAGDLTDNDRLRNKGEADKAVGRARESFGAGKRKIGEAIEDLGKNVKK